MTLEHSPQSDLLPMELPLTSSRAGFRAKTSAYRESRLALAKAPEADCGASAYVLLANYDHNTHSLKMSQTSFLDQQNNQADGSQQFFGTWPASGMMSSGTIYQLATLVPGPKGREFGYLPTPLKNSGNGAPYNRYFGSTHYRHNYAEGLRSGPGDPLYPQPDFAEQVMGFPIGWTELQASETP